MKIISYHVSNLKQICDNLFGKDQTELHWNQFDTSYEQVDVDDLMIQWQFVTCKIDSSVWHVPLHTRQVSIRILFSTQDLMSVPCGILISSLSKIIKH